MAVEAAIVLPAGDDVLHDIAGRDAMRVVGAVPPGSM
jgi:hypothetical protein